MTVCRAFLGKKGLGAPCLPRAGKASCKEGTGLRVFTTQRLRCGEAAAGSVFHTWEPSCAGGCCSPGEVQRWLKHQCCLALECDFETFLGDQQA